MPRNPPDLSDLNIENILTAKGSYKQNNKWLCVIHKEKSPSLSVSWMPEFNKQLWYCFGCGQGGDYIDMIALLTGIDRDSNFRNILESLDIQLDTPIKHTPINKKTAPKKIPEIQPNILAETPPKTLQQFAEQRKISIQTLKKVKAYPCDHHNKLGVCFPYLNRNNEVISWQIRYLTDPKRWHNPSGRPLTLYNLPTLTMWDGPVIVCEGVTDTLTAIDLYGEGSIVGVPGANFFGGVGSVIKQTHKNLIRMIGDRPIIVIPDNDRPGVDLYKRIKELADSITQTETAALLIPEEYSDLTDCRDRGGITACPTL